MSEQSMLKWEYPEWGYPLSIWEVWGNEWTACAEMWIAIIWEGWNRMWMAFTQYWILCWSILKINFPMTVGTTLPTKPPLIYLKEGLASRPVKSAILLAICEWKFHLASKSPDLGAIWRAKTLARFPFSLNLVTFCFIALKSYSLSLLWALTD